MAGDIEPLDWGSEFLPWISDAWDPGEHMSIIAPTGAGKTVFAGGILEYCRKYVLALDAKGGDSSLADFGFPRLAAWPGHKKMVELINANEEHRLPSRYIIGNVARTSKEFTRLVDTLAVALVEASEMGDWTLYADELMILTDPRQFNLRTMVDRILISARDRGTSLVSSYQSPSWVTPQAARQSTWVALSYTRDMDAVDRLAEIVGRDKAEIRGCVRSLKQYHWMVFGRDPHQPIRVTIPTYEPRRAAS